MKRQKLRSGGLTGFKQNQHFYGEHPNHQRRRQGKHHDQTIDRMAFALRHDA